MTEDEMVGWHHRLNGHEFEQALGVGDGQGATPWAAAHQAPPFMGFSRREYWSGLPLPSPSISRETFKVLELKRMAQFHRVL